MVLIVKSPVGKRCDMFFIAKRVLNEFLERHVERRNLTGDDTCFVTSERNWTGMPSNAEILDLLIDTIKHHRVLPGERRYPIPSHLLHNVKCLNFHRNGIPYGGLRQGEFVFTVEEVDGRSNSLISFLDRFYGVNPWERMKIKNTFKKQSDKYEKENVYVITHIHPARIV